MFRSLYFYFLVLTCSYLSVLFGAELPGKDTPSHLLRLPLEHQGSHWYLASESPDASQEFYPEGQDSQNWEEKITLHVWDPLSRAQLLDYPKALNRYLKEKHPGKQYFRVIQKDNKSLFFEWENIHSSENDQHEWFRILSHEHFSLAVRYTLKDLAKTEEKRVYWEGVLLRLRMHLSHSHKTPPHKKPSYHSSTTPEFIYFHNPQLQVSYLVPVNWKISLKEKEQQTLHIDPHKKAEFSITRLPYYNNLSSHIQDFIKNCEQEPRYGMPLSEEIESKENLYILPFEKKTLANGKSIQYTLIFMQGEKESYQLTFSSLIDYQNHMQPLIQQVTQSLLSHFHPHTSSLEDDLKNT